MRLVDAATITPPPNSATNKKLVPKPGFTAAESTYEPRVVGAAALGVSLAEATLDEAPAAPTEGA